MDMKILKSEKRLCTCCMEEHEVKTVLVMDKATFKNTEVDYEAYYLYCDLAEELYMDEKQMQDNDTRMKDSYREKKGLLTSTQISGIRAKYGISQSDLCVLLGWGGKTITRYESHQVQDKAHDTILKKIDQESIKEDLKDTYLLVNTTSVGMAPHPEGCIIESADMLPDGLKVADIIYNPKETKLLSYARQRGLDYMNGERMIVYQGACSFKFWTGKDMPIHEVKVALGMEESE